MEHRWVYVRKSSLIEEIKGRKENVLEQNYLQDLQAGERL
jgi:hypothetical protein